MDIAFILKKKKSSKSNSNAISCVARRQQESMRASKCEYVHVYI